MITPPHDTSIADDEPDLPFPVLSDSGNRLDDALGITMTPSDRVRDAQQRLGLDPREVNVDGSAAIPMPTVALVDASGILRWIDVRPDHTTRTERVQIMAAVRTQLGTDK